MKQDHRRKTLLTCAVVALVFAVPPGTANADPTPAPDPGYQIAGPSGPVYGGMRTLPPSAAPCRERAQGTGIQIRELGSSRREPERLSRRLNK